MSNTIEDTIRDIIYNYFEEEKEDMKQEIQDEVVESINFALPDYDVVEAFRELTERIEVLEKRLNE